MNIILVAKPYAVPKVLDLKCGFTRVRIGLVLMACTLFCAGMGFLAALIFVNPRDRALSEIRSLRDQIGDQNKELGSLENTSRRDLDALALKLGELQAQSIRLNALGERLTRAGKLDDGEFNFSEAPAMGGPRDPAATSHQLDNKLSGAVEQLRDQLSRQEAQLTVLENLLLDRHVDNALLPKGMPVETGYLGSGYGERNDPISGQVEFHAGLDFDAPLGTAIQSVAEGVVTWSGDRPGYGNVVEIDHGNGYMTRYAHNSHNLVQVGERVHAGEAVAQVGATGRATGPHCHFEVWLNGHAVNPLSYVHGKHG